MSERLRPNGVTLSQRWMMPATVVVNKPLPEVLAIPAYQTLDGILDIRIWGWLFVASGVVQAGALLIGKRTAYINTLGVCFVIGLLLVGCLFYGAITDRNPWTAPWFALYYTVGCLASARSLEARER